MVQRVGLRTAPSGVAAAQDGAGGPLVVTSRQDEFVGAVCGTAVLTAAAGIELDKLTVTDLGRYLPRTTRRTVVEDGTRTGLWRQC